MRNSSRVGLMAGATVALLVATAQVPAFADNTAPPAPAINMTTIEHPYKAADNSPATDGGAASSALRGGFATSPVASFSWSWNGVTINVPAGCFLNMTVHGSGLKLDGTISGVECVGPAATIPGLFCNWSGVYRFLDSSGREYARQTTAVRNGCGQASFNIPGASARTMKTGSICIDFRNNGTTRGTTCMAVFP